MPPQPVGTNTAGNEVALLAQQLVKIGMFKSLDEAMRYAQSNPDGARVAASKAAAQNAAATSVANGVPRQGPPAAAPAPTPPVPTATPAPAPKPALAHAGVEGDPGLEKYAADDKYGAGMRQNTNQAGVQSNGDDDPWSIGAFDGGTYRPEVVAAWRERAKAGDPAAMNLMKQIGMTPQMGEQEWAASRNLQTRDVAFGAGGKYYRQPAQQGPGAVRRDPTPQNGIARDQGINTVAPLNQPLPVAADDGTAKEWQNGGYKSGFGGNVGNEVEPIEPERVPYGNPEQPKPQPYSNDWASQITAGIGAGESTYTDKPKMYDQSAADAGNVGENLKTMLERPSDNPFKQWFRQ